MQGGAARARARARARVQQDRTITNQTTHHPNRPINFLQDSRVLDPVGLIENPHGTRLVLSDVKLIRYNYEKTAVVCYLRQHAESDIANRHDS